MASFVDIKHSTQHPGVARAESAFDAVRQLGHGLAGSRSLATLLLSAMAAAVMVVAYEVMDNVAEGHLMVLWISMWAVAFSVLALLAGAASNLAARIKAGLDAWSRSMAQSRADQRLWAIAQSDPRVMADLQAATSRAETDATIPLMTAITKQDMPEAELGSQGLRTQPHYFI
jgi:hypothetical protein